MDKTDEEKVVAKVRHILETEVLQKSKEYDRKEEFPWDCVKALAPAGVWGVLFPKEYGGLGLSHKTYVQILEELGRIDPSLALTAESHNSLCGNTILMFGNESQKKKYLTPMASGKSMGAWALTEPEAGSDAKSIKTTAELQGNHWIINGSKTFTTQGSVAGVYVIFAVTTPGGADQGISAFVTEKVPGIEIGKKEKKMGLRGSDTAQLHLINLKIPKKNLLGNLNRGFQMAMKVLDAGRVAISGISLGMARGALEEAIKRVTDPKLKTQNSKLKIHNENAVGLTAARKMIANYAARLHAARLLALFAADLIDQKKRFAFYGSMAKLISGELAISAPTDLMDLLGEDAMRFDNHVAKLFRDAKLYQIGEGTSEIQGLIISRYLFSNPDLLLKPQHA